VTVLWASLIAKIPEDFYGFLPCHLSVHSLLLPLFWKLNFLDQSGRLNSGSCYFSKPGFDLPEESFKKLKKE